MLAIPQSRRTPMRHMVRTLVGTMLRAAPAEFARLLEGRPRGGPLTPPPPRPLSRVGAPTTSLTVHVLLTNDDNIQATGPNAMRRALLEVPDLELSVIAPDSNRSATARSITTRKPLWVDEIEFGDGTTGYATDGTPVDCVALRRAGPRGVQARPDRLGDQPRLQPGRRHHLLRHRRRGARGHRPRHTGDRRLPAGGGGDRRLPRRPSGRSGTSRRRRVRRADGRGDGPSPCPRAR